jgi:hypothetical protein
MKRKWKAERNNKSKQTYTKLSPSMGSFYIS